MYLNSLQNILVELTNFINGAVIPLMFGIALLAFVFNGIRYFILGADNQQGRERAKKYALYSIIGFIIMAGIWGIVNLLLSSFGLCRDSALRPDYMERNPYDRTYPCQLPTPTPRPNNFGNNIDGYWVEESPGVWVQQ